MRVLRKEAEKYSEVRSRLATVEGLQAAALFQEGLKQAALPVQSPVKGTACQADSDVDGCVSAYTVGVKGQPWRVMLGQLLCVARIMTRLACLDSCVFKVLLETGTDCLNNFGLCSSFLGFVTEGVE